ncbi:DUF541 domain-containing protein [Halonotius terrestris]|uniref:DUF541 domain-containing protein n=1 Tax=Halonotius terrestris TaxID=2487750 RepID=A0A8J8PC38_9EURY|nr:SIMPL domain-containing protein [Halonotius terrestris]TQQ83793.1 DUF541 domain-containing protein [Halonotius terrestris]
MDRRTLLLGVAAAGTTALSGCLSAAQSGATGGDSNLRTITVTGTAEMQAPPDRAVVEVSVEATGDTAASVRDQLSTDSERLTQALREAGLSDEQITTGRFSIREERVPPRLPESETPDEPVYFGTHSFTLDIDSVDSTGDVIDAAIDGGADSIDRIEYTLSDGTRDSLREDALQSAVDNARTEADVLAERVDSGIIDVQHVTSAGGGLSPSYARFDEEAMADAASTDLRPDDVTVSATVEVTYRIS